MKNMKKLVALFAATAMACSMSISAFAAPTLTKDASTATLTINVTDAKQDQLTMMAYVVKGTDWTVENVPAYSNQDSNQEIVALDQEVGSKGFTTVPVDVKKLADGNTIVVKIGGSAGKVDTYLITMVAPATTYSITFELNGGTGTNPGATTFTETDTIKDFFAKNVTAPTKAATSEYTYAFRGWSKTNDENGALIDTNSTELMTTLLDAGKTSVTLYALYTATAVTPPAETIIVYCGDVTGDGIADATDAGLISKAATGGGTAGGSVYAINALIKSENGVNIICGDVTGDGIADATDAGLISKAATGGGTAGGGIYAIGAPITVEVPKN